MNRRSSECRGEVVMRVGAEFIITVAMANEEKGSLESLYTMRGYLMK